MISGKNFYILLFLFILFIVLFGLQNQNKKVYFELDKEDPRSLRFKDIGSENLNGIRKENAVVKSIKTRNEPQYSETENTKSHNVPNEISQELNRAKAQIVQLSKKIAIYEGTQEKYGVMKEIVQQTYPKIKNITSKYKKTILVTGGAGFLGSHLVDVLMVQGHHVIVVDNFFTGHKSNVKQWFGHKNFQLIYHDIEKPLSVQVDEIYHLASLASAEFYTKHPVKTLKTNILGTINMLDLARAVRAKILIASSSDVYGNPTVNPQPETFWGLVNHIGPRASYVESKRVSETLAFAYAKKKNMSTRVARIFNTFGPRMPVLDGNAVSNFIVQALQNLSITVHSNGTQTRTFCYVSDVVDGLIALMASRYTMPVNIGNTEEISMTDLATLVKGQVPGCRSEVTTSGKSVGENPQRRCPDIAVANEYINWTPKVTLKNGLQQTIKYFKEELSRRFKKIKYFKEELARRTKKTQITANETTLLKISTTHQT